MANTGDNNPGNFANDPERASEAGKKGGQASGGNFANDPERASEAGKKGGQASGGSATHDAEEEDSESASTEDQRTQKDSNS